jgi:hypothetical protein
LDKLSVASTFVSSRFKSPATNRSISLASRSNPSAIADRIAIDLPIEASQKQELLELLNPAERLEKLLGHFPDRSVYNYQSQPTSVSLCSWNSVEGPKPNCEIREKSKDQDRTSCANGACNCSA